MADKTLVEHVKRRLRLNHDIKLVRDSLLQRGFSYADVHQAIDAAFKEIDREADIIKTKEIPLLEQIITPKRSKLILPAIIFIILLLHLFGNVTTLPGLGRDLCENAGASAELKEAIGNSGNIAELQKAVFDRQVMVLDKFKSLLTYNFPLVISKAYKLNPFFPLPCEISSFAQSNHCTFYMTEEDYDCITKKEPELSYTLFGSSLPDYKGPSSFLIFLNSLLLLAVFYIISSFLLYFYQKATRKMTAKKMESIQVAVISAIIIIITLLILSYIYLLNLINARFG